MRFAIPRIWREPSNHPWDCYFCMVDPSKQRKGKNTPPIEYPNIPPSIAPVPHNTSDLPVPNPPTKAQQMVAVESSEDSEMEEGEPFSSFGVRRRQWSRDERCPYHLNQKDINDFIREMGLTKSNAELLVFRLKQWDLLDNGKRITRGRGIAIFPGFSLYWMSGAIVMTSEGFSKLLEFPATPMIGVSLLVKESQSCLAAQHQPVSFHSFGSFHSYERELSEWKNSARCIKLRSIRAGYRW